MFMPVLFFILGCLTLCCGILNYLKIGKFTFEGTLGFVLGAVVIATAETARQSLSIIPGWTTIPMVFLLLFLFIITIIRYEQYEERCDIKYNVIITLTEGISYVLSSLSFVIALIPMLHILL